MVRCITLNLQNISDDDQHFLMMNGTDLSITDVYSS